MVIAFIPTSLFRRQLADRATAWHANVIVSHGLLFLAVPLAALLVNGTIHLPHVCLCKTLLAISCPGCGITTSIACVATGRVSDSLAANPAGIVLLICLAAQAMIHLIALLGQARRRVCNRISRGLSIAFLIVLGLVWVARL